MFPEYTKVMLDGDIQSVVLANVDLLVCAK